MIPKGAFLKVVDNSGARLAQVIGSYGHMGQFGHIGDVVKVAIKDARGEKAPQGTMKKAVIVETKFPTHRKNGSHFCYTRNACVLLSEKGTPVGNRVRSMLSYEFFKPRWKRLSLIGSRLF
ncbi:ribosomal protein L14 domain-containing protein [Haematococcus lacustris]